jgi:urocanate hydratase
MENKELKRFRELVVQGIPAQLPPPAKYDDEISHAPKRKDILTREEKVLALKNALRYFPKQHHKELSVEFARELEKYGRIYMYRFRPEYRITARSIDDFPHKSR